jgi:hypothetical protein
VENELKKARKQAKKERKQAEQAKKDKEAKKAAKAARKRDRDQEGDQEILQWHPDPRGPKIKDVSPKKRRKNERARGLYGASQQQLIFEQRIAVLEVASVPYSPHPPQPSHRDNHLDDNLFEVHLDHHCILFPAGAKSAISRAHTPPGLLFFDPGTSLCCSLVSVLMCKYQGDRAVQH